MAHLISNNSLGAGSVNVHGKKEGDQGNWQNLPFFTSYFFPWEEPGGKLNQ